MKQLKLNNHIFFKPTHRKYFDDIEKLLKGFDNYI